MDRCGTVLGLCLSLAVPLAATAGTRIRIMPPDGSVFAVDQRFDLRVEATGSGTAAAPAALCVLLDGRDLPGEHSPPGTAAGAASFARRGLTFDAPGEHDITAHTPDGASAQVRLTVEDWRAGAERSAARRARNVILLLGDGLAAAHRTAARIVSHGVANGKARGRLAMDSMPVTGQVMTFSLNSIITDSSPGMAAYVTGSKSNNNQQGVFPDDTPDAFDNPRVEYLGELLRRLHGFTGTYDNTEVMRKILRALTGAHGTPD